MAAERSEYGKEATRFADRVFVQAQHLALLEEFYTPRATAQEVEAREVIAGAMQQMLILEATVKRKTQAGELVVGVAEFVTSERVAAQMVVANLNGISEYRSRSAQSELIFNSALWRMEQLYGRLPGPPDTPQFYLGLLAWARYGFPENKLKLAVRPRPLTIQEAQRRKFEQLVKPGGFEALRQATPQTLDEKFIEQSLGKRWDSGRQ